MRDHLRETIQVTRSEWGSAQAARQMHPVPADEPYWTGVEAHHGGRPDLTRDGYQALPDIQAAQQSSGNYSDIWYHLAIDQTGQIFEARGIDWKNNSADRTTLTVLFVGGYDLAGANPLQLAAFERIRRAIALDNPNADNVLTWHAERAATACCGAKLIAQLTEIRAKENASGGFVPAPPEPVDPEWFLDGMENVYDSIWAPAAVLIHDDLPGYAVVAMDGAVFTFGGFPFLGSVPQHAAILEPADEDTPEDWVIDAKATVKDGQAGYVMVTVRGAVWGFGVEYAGRIDVVDD